MLHASSAVADRAAFGSPHVCAGDDVAAASAFPAEPLSRFGGAPTSAVQPTPTGVVSFCFGRFLSIHVLLLVVRLFGAADLGVQHIGESPVGSLRHFTW